MIDDYELINSDGVVEKDDGNKNKSDQKDDQPFDAQTVQILGNNDKIIDEKDVITEVNTIAKQVKIKEKFIEQLTALILNKGIGELECLNEEIAPKRIEEFKKLLTQNKIFQEYIEKKNEKNSSEIKKILIDCDIDDDDDLHARIINRLISNEFKIVSLNEFEKELSKDEFNKFKEEFKKKIKSTEQPELVKEETGQTASEGPERNFSESNNPAVGFVDSDSTLSINILRNELAKVIESMKLKPDLVEYISNSIVFKYETGLSKLAAKIPANKINILEARLRENAVVQEFLNKFQMNGYEAGNLTKDLIHNILKESGVIDDENLYERIATAFNESQTANALYEFDKDLPSEDFEKVLKKLQNLEKKLWVEKKPNKSEKNSVDQIDQSMAKYQIETQLDMRTFSKLEGFVNSQEKVEIEKKLEKIATTMTDSSNDWTKSLFEIIMYLIKRRQNLREPIQSLNHYSDSDYKFSARELIYNLLLNSDTNLKIRLFFLLSASNPIPFVNYYKAEDKKKIELKLVPEVYWTLDKESCKILSLTVDPRCKGKTFLLNELFKTSFEKSLNSIFFQGTIDLFKVTNFGRQKLKLTIFDQHGVMDKQILDKICCIMDIFIIHIGAECVDSNKEELTCLLDLIIHKKNNLANIFLLVRDMQDVTKKYSTCQIKIKQKYPFLSKYGDYLNIVQLPNLNLIDDKESYTRLLRDFVYQHIKSREYCLNVKLLDIFDKDQKELVRTVMDLTKPLLDVLKKAVRTSGINYEDLFRIYPLKSKYLQMNLELNKITFFSINKEKITQLEIEIYDLEKKIKAIDKRESMVSMHFENFILSEISFLAYIHFLTSLRMMNEKSLIEDLAATNVDDSSSSKEKFFQKRKNDTRITPEIVWRELVFLIEKFDDPIYDEKNKQLENAYLKLILNGIPFEIFDGDNFYFNKNILKRVFSEFTNRIKVISILGPQNSGKSTLLNFMFGCDFSVSDGRCTKGIYGSLIKSSCPEFDYYLILDTEGLQSVEKGDKEYERKLILFCFAISHLVIINNKDEINDDMNKMIETCVDSLKKIEMARVEKPLVYFVMNQQADPDIKKNQEAIQKIINEFWQNGFSTLLQLDETNFKTLPSAFNTYTTILNKTEPYLHYETQPNFVERVSQLTFEIIQELKKPIDVPEHFKNIPEWIDFSDCIFTTINKFPDLYFFNDIVEKKQDQRLHDELTKRLQVKLEEKNELFERLKLMPLERGKQEIHNFFIKVNTFFKDEIEFLNKTTAFYERIITRNKEILENQLNQTREIWSKELVSLIRGKEFTKAVQTGEGQINNKIIQKLKTGIFISKEDAEVEFNNLYDPIVKDISKEIYMKILADQSFDFIFTLYSLFESANLPIRQSCLEYVRDKTMELSFGTYYINCQKKDLNLELVMEEFEIIDSNYIAQLYYDCFYNVLSALKEIEKHQKDYYNMTIYEISSFYQRCQETLSKHGLNLNQSTTQYSFFELTASNYKIDFIKSTNHNQNKNFDMEKIKMLKASIEESIKSDKSKIKIDSIDISFMVRNYLNSNLKVINGDLLNRDFFFKKVKEIVECETQLAQTKSISNETRPINNQIVQLIHMKISDLFTEYEKELAIFNVSLSKETKSSAHLLAFEMLYRIYLSKEKSKLENELDGWIKKRDEIKKYYVNQVSPDQSKDSNNAAQFLNELTNSLKMKMKTKAKEIIASKKDEIENNVSRLKLQEKCDYLIDSYSEEELMDYVLRPTKVILNQFNNTWSEYENSMNNEIDRTLKSYLTLFDDLKDLLTSLMQILTKNCENQEKFSAFSMFQFKNENDLQTEINQTAYLKEQCLYELFIDLITNSNLARKNEYECDNYTFKITDSSSFIEFKLKYSNYNNFLSELLGKPSNSNLTTNENEKNKVTTIQNLMLFVKSLLEIIDAKKSEFELCDFSFKALDEQKFYETCLSLAKGCETKCPCCGRPCDAEHHKIQNAIGSEHNKHKCNRGHQFRAMHGYKLEKSNEPSFKICEKMNYNDLILFSGSYITWNAFKTKPPHDLWDFNSDADKEEINKWRSKCTTIWQRIGSKICKKFDMMPTFSTVSSDVCVPPLHFILVIDSSGSMSDKWEELLASIKKFIDIRLNYHRDTITIIAFGSTAHIIKSNVPIKNFSLSDLYYQTMNDLTGGGTDYSNPIVCVKGVIDKTNLEQILFGVIFLSDGEASYPEKEINELHSQIDKIYKFWTIGFGDPTNFKILNDMAEKMRGDFRNATDAIELQNVYCEIAQNLD